MKPDDIPQDVWDEAYGQALLYVQWLVPAPTEYVQAEFVLTQTIARSILSATKAENDALPDEIDLYQMLKRSGLRKRADIAKFIATALRQRSEKQ